MNNENTKIQERIQNMKQIYVKIGELVDKLPDTIPPQTRNLIKDAILGDKELKELMESIDSHRPPRLLLMGRTGVGKSSLINALVGSYVASVSDTRSCTLETQMYQCLDGDRVLMEICDTRGIAESESLNDSITAEDMLVKSINDFSPDVAVFMLNCTHRDDVNRDVEFLKKLAESYEKLNGLQLPIVVAVNKSDEMAQSRYKIPAEYPQSKIDKIEEVVDYYKGIIVRAGLKTKDIIAVSSLLDWQTSGGVEIPVENIEYLPKNDIDNLQIAFDGRYNIEKLYNILLDSIQDFEARMGLRMSVRLSQVVKRIAEHINKIFSGIAATIALTPIPMSDIYLLVILQSVLVYLIASLSGRDISIDTAKEFIFDLGGVVGFGYSLKLLAQQATKLLNGLIPCAGSVISSSIAAYGTMAIGKAAIWYYIDGKGMNEVKALFDKEKNKKESCDIV